MKGPQLLSRSHVKAPHIAGRFLAVGTGVTHGGPDDQYVSDYNRG